MSKAKQKGPGADRAGAVPRVRRVLMPTDFSENAYRSLPWVVMAAEAFGAEIHLLHVLPDHGVDNPQYAYWAGGSFQTARFLDDAWKRIRAEKARFGEGFEPARVEVRLGDPAVQIDEYARDVGADLIVMSTHNLAWWERLLVGSVTEQVVRDAPCPVLVIPGEESLARMDAATGVKGPG